MHRVRHVLATLVLTLLGLTFLAGTAGASENYLPTPAPASTVHLPGPTVSPSAVEVSGVSDTGALAYTGPGFNLGATVTIGAFVILIGVGLVVLGTRMARSSSRGSAKHRA